MEQGEDTKAPAIGSTVRVTSKVVVTSELGTKRRAGSDILTMTVARRSIVATLPDESGCISLVQDNLSPSPIPRRGNFLIAPMFISVGVEVNECEAMASDTMPLLSYEEEDHAVDITVTKDNVNAMVQRYKDYGDQLLRLNDYTCAVSYYEAALNFVSSESEYDIGGTLVVRRKGHSVIAEVDYFENDENNNNTYDVTYLTGEEATIQYVRDILLAVWTRDATFLQVKILLNLSRCLLKLADVDTESPSSAINSRHEKYRLAAVLGCSIAITLSEYHTLESADELELELDSLMEKARIVRSRAFLRLRKLRNATSDVKKVILQNAANREAQALLAEIKAAEAYKKSVDKKLSREVCQWVQTATDGSNGAEAMGTMDDSHLDRFE